MATNPILPGTPEPNRAAAASGGDAYHALRRLGALAHQASATTRAADHFNSREAIEDQDTGSWLISCSVVLADEIATDLDSVAKGLRQSEAALAGPIQKLRVHAHQLHAAARAADHYLDQDGSDDRTTGTWLIACALNLADKLASEIEDTASSMKRVAAEAPGGFADAAPPRRPPTGPNLRAAS